METNQSIKHRLKNQK